MINPDIASKVCKFSHKMAKSNSSIAVDEDNVKDLKHDEWRIIQEIGYGESNTKRLRPNSSYQKELLQLLINDFVEIKPKRSNAISDLVSPNRSDPT